MSIHLSSGLCSGRLRKEGVWGAEGRLRRATVHQLSVWVRVQTKVQSLMLPSPIMECQLASWRGCIVSLSPLSSPYVRHHKGSPCELSTTAVALCSSEFCLWIHSFTHLLLRRPILCGLLCRSLTGLRSLQGPLSLVPVHTCVILYVII